jgi:hypothetical protein
LYQTDLPACLLPAQCLPHLLRNIHDAYIVTDDELWALFNEPDAPAFDRKLRRLDTTTKPRRGSRMLSAYLAVCQAESHTIAHQAYSLAYQISRASAAGVGGRRGRQSS